MCSPASLCRISKFDAAGSLLADYPLPFDALEAPAAPAAGGRAAAKTPARGSRRQQAAADSSDSEAEDDGGPQMPQSSDDEGDEVGRLWPVLPI